MVFNVSVGFQDLKINPNSAAENTYALLLADTVEVGKTGGHVLTDAKKRLANISYPLEVGSPLFLSLLCLISSQLPFFS